MHQSRLLQYFCSAICGSSFSLLFSQVTTYMSVAWNDIAGALDIITMAQLSGADVAGGTAKAATAAGCASHLLHTLSPSERRFCNSLICPNSPRFFCVKASNLSSDSSTSFSRSSYCATQSTVKGTVEKALLIPDPPFCSV